MTDLLDIAARLEAACDITGKPIGRHMVPGMTKLGEMQIAMGAKKGDREAGELGEVTACMTACIDNEAKLFDALAIVAKEAVDRLRQINDLMIASHRYIPEHSLSCAYARSTRSDCCTLAKHRAALIDALFPNKSARTGQSLLQPATSSAPKVCYCKATCGAPIIMGRQAPCIRGYQPGGTIPS